MKDYIKVLRLLVRISVGLLFIFSGYVKVIDPVGSAIKFGEYFEAFHMHAFVPGALVFGILLAVAELVMGICLLLGIKVKLIAWATLAFMIFFTLLTFILAVFNPVSDCGCFGDAIKLTNWETFYKNLIILPFTLFIFLQRNNIKSCFSNKTEWFVLSVLVVYTTGIAIYAYRYLPLIDFMAYKVGNNIQEGRIFPEGASQAVYDNTFIYEKNGEMQKFKIESLPDSTWTFIDTESVLIEEGYIPPMADFVIADENGNFVTDEILDFSGYTVFITSVDLTNINQITAFKLNRIYNYCRENKMQFIMLTGSADEEINTFLIQNKVEYPIYFVDQTVLKSMVRTNPGMMLLHNAVILKKWSEYRIPSVKQFEKTVDANTDKLISDYHCKEKKDTILITVVLLLFFLIMFLFKRQ